LISPRAAPNTNQVKKCLETIDTEKGVLMVVPQYTGEPLFLLFLPSPNLFP
jgi:dihydroxyacetone kinase